MSEMGACFVFCIPSWTGKVLFMTTENNPFVPSYAVQSPGFPVYFCILHLTGVSDTVLNLPVPPGLVVSLTQQHQMWHTQFTLVTASSV